MKKVISVIIAITLITCLFAGCAASSDSGVYKIAIVQQLDHASLDEIRTSVEAELDAIASEKGIRIEYKEYNGQNDSIRAAVFSSSPVTSQKAAATDWAQL